MLDTNPTNCDVQNLRRDIGLCLYEAIVIEVGTFALRHGSRASSLGATNGKHSLDDKIIAFLDGSRGQFSAGFPEFGIPPIDPFSISTYHTYIYQKGVIKADADFEHIKIAGLKNFVIKSFTFKVADLTVNFDFTIPQLFLISKYRVNGKVGSVFPFRPNGDARVEANNVTVKGEAALSTVDGYLFMKSFVGEFDVQKVKTSLSGILGNGMMNNLFNWVLSRISNNVIQAQKDAIAESASEYIVEVANSFLKEIKLSDLIV